MHKAEPGDRPLLIVVTGRPASGKTTLAHLLANRVRCPVISRDEIKEGYVNTLGDVGAGTDDIGRHVYTVFFDTIELLLRNRISLIAEAAFQHRLWHSKLVLLQELADLRIIVCQVNEELARERFLLRADADPGRERYHDGPILRVARAAGTLQLGDYQPPALSAPTLFVDTANGYQPTLEEIIFFLGGSAGDVAETHSGSL